MGRSGWTRKKDPAESHFLFYFGKLPKTNRGTVHWGVHQSLRKKCLKAWGELPAPLRATGPAHVIFTRVLGKGERLRDEGDNWPYSVKGARDALKTGGYIVDDSPIWTTFQYLQDATRRGEGPSVEVRIFYE